MNTSHIVQVALQVLKAASGAALPLIVSPMTPTAWALLIAAEASAISGVLSIQSEIKGDKSAAAGVVKP